MSQKPTRKAMGAEDKDRAQTDSPVKDIKKKTPSNVEKEKHADKEKKESDKTAEKNDKPTDKADKNKKEEKSTEKVTDKKTEKAIEKKTDKSAEKKAEKVPEKKLDKNEKKMETEEGAKDDKAGKSDKDARSKAKQNGARTNGESNGDHNGTASADDDDDVELVIDEAEENFPELAYDDTSDPEFEPDHTGRSITRRSQAKTTSTPETPRPSSGRPQFTEAENSKDSKVLKLKEDAPSDRKLRSADSPKPQEPKKQDKAEAKKTEGQDKQTDVQKDSESKEEKEIGSSQTEVQVVVEVEGSDEERRKNDTNYSKSRVKVSPYRRLADRTTSSLIANYTGNNTTMEMDITESSSIVEDWSADDSYLSGLRSIRGRRSYKPLKEMTLRNLVANRSVNSSVGGTGPELPARPTGTVVGRKRKQPAEGSELADGGSKRARLFERLSLPFRRTVTGHSAVTEIVGINTDLPQTAPVAAELKSDVPLALPTPDKDSKKCSVM